MEFNFEQSSELTHELTTKPVHYNPDGTIAASLANPPIAPNIIIRDKPSTKGNVVLSVPDGTYVTMQREWAAGNSEWAFIKTENGTEGFVMTKYTVPTVSTTPITLPKANISLKPMTQMAKVLFDARPWMENEFPINHPENGEWWITVTLPYTCIAEGSLEEKKNEAKLSAVEEIYEYFGVVDGDPDVPSIEKFNNGLLSGYVKDYYLGSRPGSNLMMLVVIPAVYVEYLKNKSHPPIIPAIEEEFCVSLKADSVDDLNNLKEEIKACMSEMYQKYVNSLIKASEFSFEDEIYKQLAGIDKIKFLLNENDINLQSKSNQMSPDDSSCDISIKKTIKVCFNSSYELIAVYYYNNSGEEILLSNGLSVVKRSEPFNDSRFGLMFLKHREICSLSPSLKQFFGDYVEFPTPEVTEVTWSEKSALPLSSLASSDLQVYIDTALFLTSLAKEFGNVFDLRSAEETLACYGDPSQSKLIQAYKLKAAEFRDSQFMYTSDIVNIASWICNLEDMDELDGIDWEGIGESIWGSGESWKDWWKSLDFSDWRWPTFSFVDTISDNIEEAYDKAKDAIQNKFLQFFATMWCELLVVAAAAAAAGIGYGIYMSIKEDQEGNVASSFPSPAETASFDYGAENINDMVSDSISGFTPETYEASLVILFRNCGVDLNPGEKSKAREYLDGVSSILAPVEVLSLLNGTASTSLANAVSKYTQASFPKIHQQKNTSSRIAQFFACLGGKITSESKDKVQKKIIDKISNLDVCIDICEELKEKMKEKCPDPDVLAAICDKEFNSKVEKFQEMISLLDDQCNLKPKFFNDNETGEKGIFSDIQPENTDLIIEKLSQTTLDPSAVTIKMNSSQYFSKYGILLSELTNKILSKQDYLVANLINLVDGDKYEINIGGMAIADVKWTLKHDGSSQVWNISLDGTNDDLLHFDIEAKPLDPYVIGIADEHNPTSFTGASNQRLLIHQAIFYGLIQDFYKKENGSPIPYSVLGKPTPFASHLDQPGDDKLFRVIYDQLLERYTRYVGYKWQGNQDAVLQEYSDYLSQDTSLITGIDDVKELIKIYYDSAEYDNPNDTETKNSLQRSLLNGILHVYFSLYIMEYFCLSMPFYEVFHSYDGTVSPNSDTLDQFSQKYIQKKLELDLSKTINGGKMNMTFNETYDHIKAKAEYSIPEYTGSDRGIKFYLNSNVDGVYEKFKAALAKNPFKKSKEWIQTGKFIFDTKKSLQTHDYAGIRTIAKELEGEGLALSAPQRPSLFKDHSNNGKNIYPSFRNGMFFIQNYFVLTDGDTGHESNEYMHQRKSYLQGVVNFGQVDKIHQIIPENHKNEKLRKLFQNVHYGSRLCFGIAYDSEDNAASDQIREFAKEFFLNYALTEPNKKVVNSGKLSENFLQASENIFPYQKAGVCVDGYSLSDFKLSDALVDGTDGEYAIKTSEDVINSAQYPLPDGTFSVVIPMFEVVQEADMDQTWTEFRNDVLDSVSDLGIPLPLHSMPVFKNLNDDLISSKRYEALTSVCFPLKNMIDFVAISGIQQYAIDSVVQNSFVQSKDFMMKTILAVSEAKENN